MLTIKQYLPPIKFYGIPVFTKWLFTQFSVISEKPSDPDHMDFHPMTLHFSCQSIFTFSHQ